MIESLRVNILIVEENAALANLWQQHLERQGGVIRVSHDEDTAIEILRTGEIDVIVANLDLPGSSAMAVADYAAYRQPDARVVFVTASSFFNDVSIFAMSPNACAFLPARTEPEDLAAIVAHHAGKRPTAAE